MYQGKWSQILPVLKSSAKIRYFVSKACQDLQKKYVLEGKYEISVTRIRFQVFAFVAERPDPFPTISHQPTIQWTDLAKHRYIWPFWHLNKLAKLISYGKKKNFLNKNVFLEICPKWLKFRNDRVWRPRCKRMWITSTNLLSHICIHKAPCYVFGNELQWVWINCTPVGGGMEGWGVSREWSCPLSGFKTMHLPEHKPATTPSSAEGWKGRHSLLSWKVTDVILYN